jgi:hypothetical protein
MTDPKTKSEKAISWIALVVSITSAIFTYVQISTTKAQLKLAEQQIRPYVKYIPNFSESKQQIDIEMILENLNSVPAKVIYTELTPWIDGVTSGTNMHSITPDILYQHRGGGSTLPPITGEYVKRLLSGHSTLEIGVCVIYSTTSKSDPRRWKINSLYEYIQGSAIPQTSYVEEEDALESETKCDSKSVRDLFIHSKQGTNTKSAGVESNN